MTDKDFMEIAISLAKKAHDLGEIPVGAIIVKDGIIIGEGYNKKELNQDASAHGEVIAIKEASIKLNNWRLNGTTLYVTLEPCPMCASLIIQSRISRVVIACPSYQSGAFGTVLDLSEDPVSHRRPEIIWDFNEGYEALLNDFFIKRRTMGPNNLNHGYNIE